MSDSFTRRSMLQGFGALSLGALVPGSAAAAASSASAAGARRMNDHYGAQYRFSIGDAQCTSILDAKLNLPTGAFGTNVDASAVTSLLNAYNLPTDGIPASVSVLLVEAGGELTLMDTGSAGWNFAAVEEGGMLMPTLELMGVAPGDIDRVVLSHFHPDHVGGASMNGRPAFPNATYMMSQAEMDFLNGYEPTGDEQADATVATAQEMLAPIIGDAEAYGDGDEIAPGLTAVAAPGHTPGHFAFLMESAGERLMLGSDTSNHFLVTFQNPEWLFAFDALPEETVATRRRLLGQAADEDLPYWATHMPFPGVGSVSRDGGGFRFTPSF